MGIKLDEWDIKIITTVADNKVNGISPYSFLFGVLQTSVDLFLAGLSKRSDLDSMYASVKLAERLYLAHSVEELREIASGTREVAGEDVPSGQ